MKKRIYTKVSSKTPWTTTTPTMLSSTSAKTPPLKRETPNSQQSEFRHALEVKCLKPNQFRHIAADIKNAGNLLSLLLQVIKNNSKSFHNLQKIP